MAIIKAAIRGNGSQLASYLLSIKDNESIRILDVDGAAQFTRQGLRDLLGDFSLSEKLTKSRQGVYHAIINPEEDYSKLMSDEEWLQSADILAEELKFTGQRRAIVLHSKHGRTHCHIAFERYNHETGKMIAIDHNYRKHDKARARIEQTLNQQPTPRRNPHRPEMKKTLTDLWQEHTNARSFLQQAEKAGYVITNGYGRALYMVVDNTGQSFNLVRHLNGVKVKEVKARFQETVLPDEKQAISLIRQQEATTGQRSAKARKKVRPDENKDAIEIKRAAFIENLNRLKAAQQNKLKGPRMR